MISLCLITKNEEKNLDQCLASIAPYVDEVCITDTGSTDGTLEIAKKYGARISHFEWVNDFSKARQYNYSQANGDWIIWCDADDVIEGAENIRAVVEGLAPGLTGVSFVYKYAFNTEGVCVSEHWKTRLIKNDGSYEWKGRLHEDLIPTRKGARDILMSKDVVYVHQQTKEEQEAKVERNLEIMEKEMEDVGRENADPRSLFNLGNCYLGARNWEKALDVFTEYVDKSGWDKEIYVAWNRIAFCLFEMKYYPASINACMEAIKLLPQYPEAYLGICKAHFEIQDYKKVIEFGKIGLQSEDSIELPVRNPRDGDANLLWLIANAMAITNDVKGSIKAFKKFLQYNPGHEEGIKRLKTMLGMQEQLDVGEAALMIGGYIKDDKEKMRHLLDALPPEIQTYPPVANMRKSTFKKTKSTGRDLAIFCGNVGEEWGPESLKTGGIGGSEEAVVHMSRLLSEKGWNVTVYGNTPESKPIDHEGVQYRPFWDFGRDDKWDVLVLWRSTALLEQPLNAGKIYVWLHDTMSKDEFTEEKLQHIDKVIVLSGFHRSLYPNIPDEKIMLSANGIDVSQFSGIVQKDPIYCINTSAPDRGLDTLAKLWKRVKEQVPEALCAWFYGWETFDIRYKDNPQMMKWKEDTRKDLKEAGIMEMGRVDHYTIAKEYEKAGLWVYPTEFSEISCISAMKAQYAGAIPVTTDIFALKETVQHGIKLPYEKMYTDKVAQDHFVEETVRLLKDHKAQQDIRNKMTVDFSWEKVAEQWDDEFIT